MEKWMQDVLDEHRTHLGFCFPPKGLREGDTLQCSCKGMFLLLKPADEGWTASRFSVGDTFTWPWSDEVQVITEDITSEGQQSEAPEWFHQSMDDAGRKIADAIERTALGWHEDIFVIRR